MERCGRNCRYVTKVYSDTQTGSEVYYEFGTGNLLQGSNQSPDSKVSSYVSRVRRPRRCPPVCKRLEAASAMTQSREEGVPGRGLKSTSR